MDIRKWLAETENPILSEQPEVDRFLLPRQPDTAPDTRRRRKRSSSDSSLLKATSPQPRRKGVTAKKPDRCEISDGVNENRSDISHSSSGGSTGSSTGSQRYARQPRRKTRADKYDVGAKKAKVQNEDQRPSRKSESKKSKRKSRRRKDEKTHNGIGQEFQAKNVSKERLTLKPSEKIGLFSKSRTSTSIKGRGLPDLVFSEMKFLRNNDGRKDHTTQAPDAKKKRKKDHARNKEEDISAFFTTAPPALADTDANAQAKSRRPTGVPAGSKADRRRPVRDLSRAPESAIPIVDSEGKASYLGLVRFAVPDFLSSRLPNSSGPTVYVQQEHRQLLPARLVFDEDGGYNYPDGDGCGQEYMSDAGVLDHGDFEELTDEQLPYGLMEELDDDVEGLDYVADGVQQVEEPEHTGVVTPGFWRPNRLY
ncbi:hypothetical protein E8E11_000839 [Didymella keratinophila]|nr:hypothetical protein E8E11_000839 [Didymella keratinophila]